LALNFTRSDKIQWSSSEIDIKWLLVFLMFNNSRLTIKPFHTSTGTAHSAFSVSRLTIERSVFLLLSDLMLQYVDRVMEDCPSIIFNSQFSVMGYRFRAVSLKTRQMKYRYTNLKKKEVIDLGYAKIRALKVLIEGKKQAGDQIFDRFAPIFNQGWDHMRWRTMMNTAVGIWTKLRHERWSDRTAKSHQ
jgi:hypothetical protein